MKRIPSSRKMRQEIKEMFTRCETEEHPLDKFVSLGARNVLQVAAELLRRETFGEPSQRTLGGLIFLVMWYKMTIAEGKPFHAW